MKKKNLLAIMLMMIMVLTGCGNSATVNTNDTKQDTVEVTSEEIVVSENATEIEAAAENSGFVKAEDIDSLITEKDKSDLNLKEYFYSYEDKDAEKEGDDVFYLANFESTEDYFYMIDSVDIYAYNGVCIGYTKPDISISMIGKCDNWYYFDLNGDTRFVKVSDVEKVGFVGSKDEYLASLEPKVEEPNTQKPASGDSTSNPVANNPEVTSVPGEETPAEQSVVDTPVTEAQTSNKYTPEEAIAVYRSLMEAGGITWDPSLKNGGSWGTGWIYLEKGQPEWCASTDLESFAMGDSGGHSWTKYYLEVTGSDDEAVYITEWAD